MKKSPAWAIVFGLICAAIAVVWIVDTTVTPKPSARPSASIAASAVPAPLPHRSTPWTYTERVDPMTDGKVTIACTTSTNEVVLTLPYHNVTAELCLRDSPRHGQEAWIQLDGAGQILCDIEYCSIPVRFGSTDKIVPKDATSLSVVGPADQSTNIIFIKDYNFMMLFLPRSSTLTAEVRFYQNGAQDLVFPVSGLKWEWRSSMPPNRHKHASHNG